MAFYNLSENRVRRVIKFPLRTEEGIAENTVAFMQPPAYKTKNGKKIWSQEIWVMAATQSVASNKLKVASQKSVSKNQLSYQNKSAPKKLKIISVWRYPGVTKEREKLPQVILDEISQALSNNS